MNKHIFANPAFIGFGDMIKQLEQVSAHAKDTYPPYNVVQEGQSFLIEVAVAGFSMKDLSVDLHNNILTITGEREQRREQDTYVFKGISARKFSRGFRLSEYAIVESADLHNGLLTVNIDVKIPEKETPKNIQISE